MVGHVAPEAARGGPLAVVRDGDTISIDVDAALTSASRSTTTSSQRGSLRGRRPELPYATGVFGRYRALVGSASEGAVLRNGVA